MSDTTEFDARFHQAVEAMDAGDVAALESVLEAHPELVRERLGAPEWLRALVDEALEGYFNRPYLLWFVAENPVRNDRLPANAADVARTLIAAVRRDAPETFNEQVDYALELVCSGRVPREAGVQRALIDVLADAGADLDKPMMSALAHRERAAVERLLERGARRTLLVAACMGAADEVEALARDAAEAERQVALAGAALWGRAAAIRALVKAGADIAAFAPAGFHAHATPLHHAVDSGSVEAVRVLADAGAALATRDRLFDGTPLGWAEYLHRDDVAAFLRERGAPA